MYDIELITTKTDIDCGPACMAMLLKYYGINVSLDTLSQECNLHIRGCSGTDLMRVGRSYGLDMKAFRMDAEELMNQDRPAIIWWSYTHWVVMCGFDNKGNVVIANPARGRFGIDQESFSKIYTGVCLFNGEPETLSETNTLATIQDYEEALQQLGVSV